MPQYSYKSTIQTSIKYPTSMHATLKTPINIDATSYDVESTLKRRCFDVMCLLGTKSNYCKPLVSDYMAYCSLVYVCMYVCVCVLLSLSLCQMLVCDLCLGNFLAILNQGLPYLQIYTHFFGQIDNKYDSFYT